MREYAVYFKAADARTGEELPPVDLNTFYARNDRKAKKLALDIITSVFDYQDNPYDIKFFNNGTAQVYELGDYNWNFYGVPKLAYILSNIQVVMVDISHD